MKNKIAIVGMTALGVAPMWASAAVHQVVAWPPGPTLWAWIVHLFGG